MALFCPGFMSFFIPLLIGRTYDMRSHTSGLDIFPRETLNDPTKVTTKPNEFSNCTYKVISSEYEKLQLLNISDDIYLRIRAGDIKFPGMGLYIKELFHPKSASHVTIKCKVSTVIKELDPTAKPISKWNDKFPKKLLGTHYVRQVQYGGELFVAIIFKTFRIGDRDMVKTKVIEGLKADRGIFNSTTEGYLSNLIKNLTGVATVEYKYYSTLPMGNDIPTDLDDIAGMIEKFLKEFDKRDNIGTPICVGLEPLSKFDSTFTFKVNSSTAMEARISFNNLFNYIRVAKLELKNLLSKLSANIDEASESKLGKFRDRLNRVLLSFHETIANLDMEKGPEQFNAAKDAYAKNSKIWGYFNRYTEELRDMNMVVNDDPQNPRIVYTHWGAERCLKYPETLYSGYIAGLKPGVTGGGTRYHCLPKDPNFSTVDHFKGQLYGTESSLVGVVYGSAKMLDHLGYNITGRPAICAVCEIILATSIETFVGTKTCPEGWSKKYVGLIASFDGDRQRKENMCLDSAPVTYSSYPKWSSSNAAIFPAVYVKDSKPRYVPCVVCAKYWSV